MSRRDRSLRISLIPLKATASDLRDFLEGLQCRSESEGSNILAMSLAPDGSSQVATVCFVSEPDVFAECRPNEIVHVTFTHRGTKYRLAVDCDFFGLTPLYSANEPAVDIIAITGLAGHALGSWKAPGSYAVWLRDFLPKDIPDCRILTYGYYAAVQSGNSKNTIQDYGKQFLEAVHTVREGEARFRPLIFMGHSLGGIIIIQALSDTAQSSSAIDKVIKDSTTGVLLFGAPLGGLDHENLLSIAKGKLNFRLISDLMKDSSILPYLVRNFKTNCESLCKRVVSFYESRETPTTQILPDGSIGRGSRSVIMVTTESATALSWDPQNELPIDGNHSTIVKPSHQSQEGYKSVVRRLKASAKVPIKPSEICESKTFKAASAANTPYTISPQLPLRQNQNFTGREDELLSMRRMLGKTDADLGSQKLMVLHGLGGIGKTQLAVRYAYKFSEMYYSTWWINCSTKDSITRSFFDIANTLVSHHAGKLKEFGLAAVCDEYGSLATTKEMPQKIVDCVIRWLERPGNVNWLLVLDNIDDLDIFSESIIPKHNGTIIMTTRRPECLRFGIGLEVQEMEERDAVQLLLKTSGLSQTSNDPADKDAVELTKALGFLPLALDHAGAYMASRKMTFARYAKVYRKNFARIFNQKPKFESYQERTLYTTWEISFREIERQDEGASKLLLLCSFLSNEDIWDEMLRRGLGLDEDDLTLEDQLGLIFSYSLAKRKNSSDAFYIHPVVHYWVHDFIPLEDRPELTRNALELLGRFIHLPGERKIENYITERRIMPHIFLLCQNIKKYINCDCILLTNGNTPSCIYNVITTLWIHGRLKEAEELEVRVMQMSKRILGEEHPDTLTSMANLASMYSSQDKVKEAEDLGVRGMQMRKRILGEEHPDTLTSMASLAATYTRQGKLKEAEELLVPVMQMSKRILGEEHPDTLTSMTNLAVTYAYQGKIKEAEKLEVPVMQMRKRIFGEEHPDTLLVMANLATTYSRQGRLKEAEELEVPVMQMRKRILGEEHPDTLQAMGNLAETYKRQGHHKEAEELEIRALGLG